MSGNTGLGKSPAKLYDQTRTQLQDILGAFEESRGREYSGLEKVLKREAWEWNREAWEWN